MTRPDFNTALSEMVKPPNAKSLGNHLATPEVFYLFSCCLGCDGATEEADLAFIRLLEEEEADGRHWGKLSPSARREKADELIERLNLQDTTNLSVRRKLTTAASEGAFLATKTRRSWEPTLRDKVQKISASKRQQESV